MVENQLPDLLNNPVVKADLINFMADFQTVTSFTEPGVSWEYLEMIRTVGVELFNNKKDVNKDYNLFRSTSFVEFNRTSLDGPENKKVAIYSDQARVNVQKAVDGYLKTIKERRGGPHIEKKH